MQILLIHCLGEEVKCQGDNRPVRPIYGKESGLGVSSVPTSETANGVVGLDLDSILPGLTSLVPYDHCLVAYYSAVVCSITCEKVK